MATPGRDIAASAGSPFACPSCRAALSRREHSLACPGCGSTYAADPFPDFLPPDGVVHEEATDTHRRIHASEDLGMAHRAEHFYAPELAGRFELAGLRVLDDGCGSGRLVDELHRLGMDAWGIDPFNRWQAWQGRDRPDRLARADGLALPFVDGWFDAVLSNGVLEHIGHGGPGDPAPDRAEQRQRYVAEALRVLRPGGVLLLAHPNGACPVDFWHGGYYSMRPHRPYETYMPHAREVRRYAHRADPHAEVEFVSPHDYVSYARVSNDPLGRALMPLAKAVVWSVRRVPPLRASPVNPFLVARIVTSR